MDCGLTFDFFFLGLPPVGNFVLKEFFGEILSSSKKGIFKNKGI